MEGNPFAKWIPCTYSGVQPCLCGLGAGEEGQKTMLGKSVGAGVLSLWVWKVLSFVLSMKGSHWSI